MTMRKGMWGLACVLAILAMLSSPLRAQSFYGSIVGTVTDTTGAIVPGATVTITNISTNEKHTAQSSAAGEFSFVSLVPAPYSVQVEKTSFKRFLRPQVVVQINQTVRVDAALTVGATSETVEVTTETPQLTTDSATQGAVIEGKTINEMPLNGRDTFNLIALAPGVVPAQATQGTAELNSGGTTHTSIWGGYSLSGGLVGFNAMYLDGMPLNELGASGQGGVIFIPSQDAVQEFSVSTNASTSEFGRFSGGVVNMTTKSGSNSYHATAYEYVRNRDFNANDWFNKRNEIQGGQANKPPQWTQNQYGVQASAPIIKNKIFAMFSWESFVAREGSINGPFATVTPDMVAGRVDYGNGGSALTNAQNAIAFISGYNAACNPTLTTNVASGGYGVQLNGGTMTTASGCFDQATLTALTEYPAPGSPGIVTPSHGNNFQIAESVGSNRSSWIGRIDYNISSKQRLFGDIVRDNLADEPGQWLPGGKMASGQPWNIGGGTMYNQVWAGVLGDTYTINPTTIADLRFSVSRTYLGQTPPLLGSSSLASLFGTGIQSLAKQETTFNIPFVIFGTFGGAGHNSVPDCPTGVSICAPTGFNNAANASWNFDEGSALIFSLTKIHGAHNLKMGGEIRYMDNEGLNVSNSGSTETYANDAFTKNYWGNFLLDLPELGSIGTARAVASYNWYSGYYINDTWQATRKLTVNAGLRWELPGNITEKHGNAIVLEPGLADTTDYAGYSVPGEIALVNSSANAGKGDEPARLNEFAPNFGIAYRATDRDVIRAGYGYSIAPIDISTGVFPSSVSMNTNQTSWNYQNNGNTAHYTLANPFPASGFPNGINQPLTRTQVTALGQTYYYGANNGASAPVASNSVPVTQQWNLTISHQFPGDLLVEAGYAGAKSNGLPLQAPTSSGPGGGGGGGYNMNELSSAYWSDPTITQTVGTAATTTLTAGQIAQCKAVLGTHTSYGQCAKPYWGYGTYVDTYAPYGWQTYNSLPVRVQKRFHGGGLVNVSYTWSKVLSNAGGGTGGSGGTAPFIQDWDNLRAEKSVTTYNIPRRLVVSYSYNLPIGKGQRFLNTGNDVASRIVSGWTVSGITTFQDGFPQQITTNFNNVVPQLFGGFYRPNYTAGCPRLASGSVKSNVMAGNSVFNVNCWSNPPVNSAGNITSTGNEPRVDQTLTSQGPNNWDMTLQKRTQITEKVNLEFRWEAFNVFNHERFGLPSMTWAPGNSQFGTIGSTGYGANPRLQQLSLRLSF